MAFEARYAGVCQECCESIEVSQLIELSNSSAGYRHVAPCPDVPDERPTKFQGTSLEEMGY